MGKLSDFRIAFCIISSFLFLLSDFNAFLRLIITFLPLSYNNKMFLLRSVILLLILKLIVFCEIFFFVIFNFINMARTERFELTTSE